MEGDEVWVVETHQGHGESAGVHGVYASREAAFDALKELPHLTVYVDDDGRLRGRPKREDCWDRLWAVGRPMKIRGRKAAVLTPASAGTTPEGTAAPG